MKKIYTIAIFLHLVNSLLNSSFAQKRVAILGSSTAYGIGASTPDSSWVNLTDSFYNRIHYDDKDTLFTNLA